MRADARHADAKMALLVRGLCCKRCSSNAETVLYGGGACPKCMARSKRC